MSKKDARKPVRQKKQHQICSEEFIQMETYGSDIEKMS